MHYFKCHGESEDQTEVGREEEIFDFSAICEYLTRNMRQLRSVCVKIKSESTAVMNIFALVAPFNHDIKVDGIKNNIIEDDEERVHRLSDSR